MSTAPKVLLRLLNAPVEFHSRPVDLPAELRPAWRGALILLILSRCRGAAAGIEIVQFLSWAAGTPESRALTERALSTTQLGFTTLPVRFDLSVNRSLAFLNAESLVSVSRGRYSLTATGKQAAKLLDDQAELFTVEKSFLKAIAPINDAKIRRAFQVE